MLSSKWWNNKTSDINLVYPYSKIYVSGKAVRRRQTDRHKMFCSAKCRQNSGTVASRSATPVSSNCIVLRCAYGKTCMNMSIVSHVSQKLRYDEAWDTPTLRFSSVVLFVFPREHDRNSFLLSAMKSMNITAKLKYSQADFKN